MTRLLLTFLLISQPADIFLRQSQLFKSGGLSVRPMNVRQHGAVGNGSNDDTSAIVSAFSSVCAAGGGTVDIPAGVYMISPATASIPICSHLVVRGPGTLKVKPQAGNYGSIFAPDPPTAVVDDLTFTGITIDQNTSNNTTATIDTADPRTHQIVWQIWAGTNLHFENMHLSVSGVDPLDVNGPSVSGVYIERNYIVFQKRSGQREFDNSSIYIDGNNFHVTDNTFASTEADAARTAIEIHSGSGSVTGNTIDGYAVGMNLVNLKSASVNGNSIRNAGYGISLWSTTTMDTVVVSSNAVSLSQVTRATPSAWGIATAYIDGINGDFANLKIAGNIVHFEPESAPRTVTGSVNYGIGLQALGNITNASIVGNDIIRPPVRGISIGVANARYMTAGVFVHGNRIVDAGSNFSVGASDYAAAIALQGNLSSIDVLRNRLAFFSNPFIGHYSFWSLESGYSFRNVVVADNFTTTVSGSPRIGLTSSVIRTSSPQ